MSRTKLPAGHGWAYLGVVLGLTASIAGNIANTVLTTSAVPLELRVPFAVAWPVFLGIGIEVLTRTAWERNWKHWAARAILMGPMSLVSGFMSYLHLHHLMIMSGEPGLAQAIGPLAVDGTLFGCTVALLVTRVAARLDGQESAPRVTLAQRVAAARQGALDITAAAAGRTEVPAISAEVVADRSTAEQDPTVLVPAFQVPAVPAAEVPVSAVPVSPAGRTRTSVDYAKVTRLVLEHPKDQDVADLIGSSPKTPQRVRRAVRLMDTTTDLAAIANTVKLSPAAVRTINLELSNR